MTTRAARRRRAYARLVGVAPARRLAPRIPTTSADVSGWSWRETRDGGQAGVPGAGPERGAVPRGLRHRGAVPGRRREAALAGRLRLPAVRRVRGQVAEHPAEDPVPGLPPELAPLAWTVA